MYLTGGRTVDSEAPVEQTWCYSLTKNRWEEAPSMTFGRQMHGSCSLGSRLYAFGGKTADDSPDRGSIEMISPEQDQMWTVLVRAHPLVNRYSPVIGVLNTRKHEFVVLCGGRNGLKLQDGYTIRNNGAVCEPVLFTDLQ